MKVALLFNLVSFRAELMLSAAAQLDRYATRQRGHATASLFIVQGQVSLRLIVGRSG